MPVFITQMQAKFTIDAPDDLTGCDPDNVYLNLELVYTSKITVNDTHYGNITTSIAPCSEIDWVKVVTAIESGVNKTFGGGFGSTGGLEVDNGTVTIMSPDGGGDGSIITVEAPAEACIDAFRKFRDVTTEFTADPVGFVQAHRQLGHSDTFCVDTL